VTDTLRVIADRASLFDAAAATIAGALAAAIDARGRAAVVLSGGSTPRGVYERLAAQVGAAVSWPLVEWYWGDERYVPPDDPHSNYRMTREALLGRVSIDRRYVHRMPTGLADPRDAALEYEDLVARRADPFDVVLLGVGDDGHTASLFPNAPSVLERSRLVIAVEAPVEPRPRLTMTFPALLNAREIHVLASGAAKAQPMSDVARRADPMATPAAALRDTGRPTTWWLDAAAAALIDTGLW
jgi:6-phosphogluconolactonase